MRRHKCGTGNLPMQSSCCGAPNPQIPMVSSRTPICDAILIMTSMPMPMPINAQVDKISLYLMLEVSLEELSEGVGRIGTTN